MTPRRAQPLDVLGVNLGGPVGEQRHIVAPETQQERPPHTRGTPVEYTERPVADLPAMAERAVEHRATPPLRVIGSAEIQPVAIRVDGVIGSSDPPPSFYLRDSGFVS